jgi:rod shape-determining protein MreC
VESLFSRYRNITVLLFVIFAQIVLLAYQVKNNNDVRIIRIWAVTAVTPLAQVVEDSRSSVAGFFGSYVSLRDVREQNQKMQAQLDSLKMENQFLRNELSMADRVKALGQFEARSPSKMIAARIIGTGSGATNKVTFVDRGSASGVEKGMGVVTPDGIVGKVLAAYPTASQVLMVDDPGFAAGVISQKSRVRGILKGLGHGKCQVDYIQNEEKVEQGEMFYTDGEDRIFPQGMPAGKVTSASPGNNFKQIALDPSGLRNGPEEVLIVLRGVHEQIPEMALPAREIYLGPQVPAGPANKSGVSGAGTPEAPPKPYTTDADRLRQRYKDIGDAQGHKFGEGLPGSLPPDFNLKPKPAPAPPSSPTDSKPPASRPAPRLNTVPPAETTPPPF